MKYTISMTQDNKGVIVKLDASDDLNHGSRIIKRFIKMCHDVQLDCTQYGTFTKFEVYLRSDTDLEFFTDALRQVTLSDNMRSLAMGAARNIHLEDPKGEIKLDIPEKANEEE